MKLPDADQSWIHACATARTLKAALEDTAITALEADVLFGYHLVNLEDLQSRGEELAKEGARSAIMAHPPMEHSDLQFEDFLERCLANGRVHFKFDFKDIESCRHCIPLVGAALAQAEANGQAIFLNADVIPGPGFRGQSMGGIEAEEFLQLCTDHCPGALLSLSWKVKLPSCVPYAAEDMQAMMDTVRRFKIPAEQLVFAVNARVADMDMEPLNNILQEFPESQMLFWTATGEPALSRRVQQRLENGFDDGRVGFDVKLAKNALEGMVYDAALWIYARYLYYTGQEHKV